VALPTEGEAELLMDHTVNLRVGMTSRGKPVYEEVLVEPRERGGYRLLKSPGLALGLAADDIFELRPDGEFVVRERGRNVAVQLFAGDRLERLETAATAQLSQIGARLDGKSRTQLVYTVPVSAGFVAIEAALDATVAAVPGAEWYFGNVYDPVDGVTPLNWWL
jgi:hypothetical protein